MSRSARPGGSPSTDAEPACSGSRPRRTSEQRRLAAPFGPRTATNSPGSIVRSTPLQNGAAAERRGCAAAARTGAVASVIARSRSVRARRSAARSCATCHCSKFASAGESVSVTVTTGMCAGSASVVDRWTSGVDVLAVEHPHLDPACRELLVDSLLVRGAGSPPRRSPPRTDGVSSSRPRLGPAARRCSRCSRPGTPAKRAGSGAQSVVAGQRLGLEGALPGRRSSAAPAGSA